MHGEEIYSKQLVKLKNNMGLLTKALFKNENWHFIADFPVYLAKNAELSASLKQQGILISSFPYPDKDGPIINRIVLSSWHSTLVIEELTNAIEKQILYR